MAGYDLILDNQKLGNGYSYGVQEFIARRTLPGRNNGSTTTPGRDGAVPFSGGFVPATFSLRIWIDCLKPDGSEAADPRLQHDLNMEELLRMFSFRGTKLLAWAQWDGRYRYANVRVLNEVIPEPVESASPRPLAYVTILLENPYVWWRGSSLETSTIPTGGGAIPHLVASKSSAPINDGVISFHGPWVGPGLSQEGSYVREEGASFRWTGTLASGDTFRVDCGSMTATLVRSGSGAVSALKDLTYSGSGTEFFTLYTPYEVELLGSPGSGASATFTSYSKWI